MKFNNQLRKLCLDESKHYVLHRSESRQTEFGEVFTPTELVIQMLEHLDDSVWLDGKTFLEPTCGNGQFLAPVLIAKQYLQHKATLSTIYGVDFLQDNVDECRSRLLKIAGKSDSTIAIVEWNIKQGDGATFNYEIEFDKTLKEDHMSLFPNGL